MDRCLLLFIAGVAISLYLPNSGSFSWAVSTVVLAATIAYSVTRTRLVASAIMALFCGIAVTTANLNWQAQQRANLLQTESPVTLTVRIIDVPRQYAHHTRFLAEQVRESSGMRPAPRLMLNWYGQRDEALALGQTWQLTISPSAFRNYWNQGSRDYIAAMQRQRVLARATVKHGYLLSPATSPRARLATVFSNRELPHDGIIAALSIGIRDFLSHQQRQQWQAAGLSHALAISGLHLSLVGWAGLLLGRVVVARLFSHYQSAAALERTSIQSVSWLLALGIAFGYAWLADFSIATLRALLMFLVVVVHRVLCLTVSPWQLVLRTVALLLAVDPFALLDAGFWLSVTALLTILLTLWRWRQYQQSKIKALLLLQWMFLVVMAPLSLHWFGGVSLIAPLTNLLVLPVISIWLLPLTLAGTLAELSFAHQFADNLWYLATLPLTGLTPLLAELATWRWSWWQPQVAIPLPALFAVLLLVLIPLSDRFLKAAMLACLPLALVGLYNSRPRSELLYVHVLDVGQSQAVVIERAGRAWLIDTSVSYGSGYSLAEAVIQPFLEARQLYLEAAWISHSDNDHSGGLTYLKQQYPHASWYGANTATPCIQGMTGRWNALDWAVHWPLTHYGNTQRNNQSCVISIQFGHFSMLLPGDIEFPAERAIAESVGFPAVDLLVAPHHGSKTSSGWLMLKQTQPSLILISNGEHRGFNFPHRYTQSRYRHMQRLWFNTKDKGQLTVVTDGNQWRLELPFANKRRRRLYHRDD